MSWRTLTLMLTAPLLTGTLAAVSPVSAAALGPVECADTPGFACTEVSVPLDRSGRAAGTISLRVGRKPAGVAQTQTALVALTGGPGQAALPLASELAKAIAPGLTSNDLLVFDQRGTGRSGPLNCPIFSNFAGLEEATARTFGALVQRCAEQIGPARGAFTTQESVRDIESIRASLGYQKLILYGTSYGTKVALEYAERFPQRLQALVLDSVEPTDGPEPFGVPTFGAISSALAELCANRACARITANPLRDLARLTARVRRRALGGSVFDGSGHRHSVSLVELDLLGILESGDLNPALRAPLPAAVRSALRGDPDPLLRLKLLAEGMIPNVPPPQRSLEAELAEREEENNALFITTSCEEKPFPWQRFAAPETRHAEALAALRAIPSSAFYPFDPATALSGGVIPVCESWPDASPAPPAPGPLPDVPTLILSGTQDLRTPTSNALDVRAKIPKAQLLVVPHTGHSVIGADFSGCAASAVQAFFAGGPVQPCAASRNLFAPTPIVPTKLAYVHPPPGLGGKPGRTLTAALEAIVDLDREVIGATLQAAGELPSGSSFGGLRGGYAKLTSSAAILRRFSFVTGVQLSGVFPVRNGQLQPATIRISGPQAAPGPVTFGFHKHVTGTLGGKHFDVNLARVRLSRAPGAGEWPSRPVSFPLARLVPQRESLPRPGLPRY